MACLKDLRNRIASVKATQKITKAMQMVAAAKLRKAQEAAEAARPYASRMGGVLANLSAAMEGRVGGSALMAGTGKQDTHLLIVCTAERGLCGGFNSNIAKLAREHADRLIRDGKKSKSSVWAKKVMMSCAANTIDLIVDRVDLREVKHIAFGNAHEIAGKVLSMFDDGEFDVATLFYSEFQSVIWQIPTALQIIPANVASSDGEAADLGGAIYEYEPEESEILEDFLPRNIGVQIFRALLENAASEQGARMSAMDNATRNAGEMIDKLTMSYNRQRQAQITKELIEIISGAEAV